MKKTQKKHNFNKILKLLKKINKKHPDLRFGQVILESFGIFPVGVDSFFLFYIDDEKVEENLEAYLKQHEKKKKT